MIPGDFDLHSHSCYSFDGIMSPRSIVRIAQEQGLAGLAVTDHNTIRGGLEAADASSSSTFLVIIGAEIATEIGDILGLFLTHEINGRRSADVVDEIHTQGGVVVIPHPYSHHPILEPDLLRNCEAVEIYNARVAEDYSARAIQQLAEPFQLATLGSSDAHLPWEVGRAHTRLELEELSIAGVRSALTERRCQPRRVAAGQSISAVYTSKIIKRLRRLL